MVFEPLSIHPWDHGTETDLRSVRHSLYGRRIDAAALRYHSVGRRELDCGTTERTSSVMYRGGNKCLYVVAINFFLLLLNFSSWPCLGPAAGLLLNKICKDFSQLCMSVHELVHLTRMELLF